MFFMWRPMHQLVLCLTRPPLLCEPWLSQPLCTLLTCNITVLLNTDWCLNETILLAESGWRSERLKAWIYCSAAMKYNLARSHIFNVVSGLSPGINKIRLNILNKSNDSFRISNTYMSAWNQTVVCLISNLGGHFWRSTRLSGWSIHVSNYMAGTSDSWPKHNHISVSFCEEHLINASYFCCPFPPKVPPVKVTLRTPTNLEILETQEGLC